MVVSSGSVSQGAMPPAGVSLPATDLRDNQLDELSLQCSDSSASQSILPNPSNHVPSGIDNNLANGTGIVNVVVKSKDQSNTESNESNVSNESETSNVMNGSNVIPSETSSNCSQNVDHSIQFGSNQINGQIGVGLIGIAKLMV